MSFKSRERKRRMRAAQRTARQRHGEVMKGRWYLTIVKRDCCCNRCGRALRKGGDLIYRHSPKEVICTLCADREGVKFRTSRVWEMRRKARARKSR